MICKASVTTCQNCSLWFQIADKINKIHWKLYSFVLPVCLGGKISPGIFSLFSFPFLLSIQEQLGSEKCHIQPTSPKGQPKECRIWGTCHMGTSSVESCVLSHCCKQWGYPNSPSVTLDQSIDQYQMLQKRTTKLHEIHLLSMWQWYRGVVHDDLTPAKTKKEDLFLARSFDFHSPSTVSVIRKWYTTLCQCQTTLKGGLCTQRVNALLFDSLYGILIRHLTWLSQVSPRRRVIADHEGQTYW